MMDENTRPTESADITELVKALIAATAELENPLKNMRANVGKFSYAYADLPSVLGLKEPLARHGVRLQEHCRHIPGCGLLLITRLIHQSGQWMSSEFPVSPKSFEDSQTVGSAMTYARRYNAQVLIGVAAEHDDDGEKTKAAKAPSGDDVASVAFFRAELTKTRTVSDLDALWARVPEFFIDELGVYFNSRKSEILKK